MGKINCRDGEDGWRKWVVGGGMKVVFNPDANLEARIRKALLVLTYLRMVDSPKFICCGLCGGG